MLLEENNQRRDGVMKQGYLYHINADDDDFPLTACPQVFYSSCITANGLLKSNAGYFLSIYSYMKHLAAIKHHSLTSLGNLDKKKKKISL